MGYGVIGSPTGSGPVSLGSSPGTPASKLVSADAHSGARAFWLFRRLIRARPWPSQASFSQQVRQLRSSDVASSSETARVPAPGR